MKIEEQDGNPAIADGKRIEAPVMELSLCASLLWSSCRGVEAFVELVDRGAIGGYKLIAGIARAVAAIRPEEVDLFCWLQSNAMAGTGCAGVLGAVSHSICCLCPFADVKL